MRVVRFCNDDPGDSSRLPQFVSHFELVCECSGLSSSTTNIPTVATYVGANSTFGTATLLVTFLGDGETDQRMCAYNIDTINNLRTQKFSSCLDGVGVSGFARELPQACPVGLSEAQKQSVVSNQYIGIYRVSSSGRFCIVGKIGSGAVETTKFKDPQAHTIK